MRTTDHVTALRHRRRRRCWSAACRSTGWPRGSARRRSSPTTARCSPSASPLLRAALPDRPDARLRGQGQPDAGRRAAPRRPGRLARRRLGRRDARRRSTPGTTPTAISFAGPGKTDAELRQAVAAGVTVEVESAHRGCGASSRAGERARRSARASPSASTPTSRSRARACGWAAARSSSASTPSRSPPLLGELARARRRRPRLPRLRRLAEPAAPRSSPRPSEQTVDLVLGSPSTLPDAVALRQPRRRLRHPLLREGRAARPRRRRATTSPSWSTGGSRRRCPRPRVGDRARPLPRRRGRRLRDPGRRPQGVARARPTSSSTAACTTSSPPPATSARSSGATTRSPSAPGPSTSRTGARHGGRLPVHAARPARRRGRPARHGGRRPRRRLPGRRLRPHRQPDRLPRPPRTVGGPRLTHRPAGTTMTHRHRSPWTWSRCSSAPSASRTARDSIDAATRGSSASSPSSTRSACVELAAALEDRFDIVDRGRGLHRRGLRDRGHPDRLRRRPPHRRLSTGTGRRAVMEMRVVWRSLRRRWYLVLALAVLTARRDVPRRAARRRDLRGDGHRPGLPALADRGPDRRRCRRRTPTSSLGGVGQARDVVVRALTSKQVGDAFGEDLPRRHDVRDRPRLHQQRADHPVHRRGRRRPTWPPRRCPR